MVTQGPRLIFVYKVIIIIIPFILIREKFIWSKQFLAFQDIFNAAWTIRNRYAKEAFKEYSRRLGDRKIFAGKKFTTELTFTVNY